MWFASAKKLRDLEEAQEKMERTIKGLQLEWDEAYDKLRMLTGRFTKRAEQIERHEAAAVPGNGSPSATANLDPISKRILERRARMFPPKETP